jgi:acyl-CoA hydrolase
LKNNGGIMMTKSSVSSNQSRTIQTKLVLPPDTNHMGTIFGGVILSHIDEIAAISAMKHSKNVVVTASIDQVTFLSSAKVGDILTLEAVVTSTGRTSMEVFVKVENENLETGDKTTTTTSFLTMVAKDKDGKPTPVPGVIPNTDFEKELYNNAEDRKKKRLEKR